MTCDQGRHSNQSNTIGQAGFTLIEILVALVVMSLVVFLIGHSLSVFSSSWSRQLDALERQDTLLRGTHVFRRDIRSIRPVPVNAGGRKSLLFDGRARSLRFVGFGPAHVNQPGLLVIEYRLVPSANGYQLVRRYGPFQRSQNSIRTRVDFPVVVLDKLSAGEFLYGSHRGQGINWRKQWRAMANLPNLVSISGRVRTVNENHVIVANLRSDSEQACILSREEPCSIAVDNAGNQSRSRETR